jgi:hypothetical protein
MTRDLPFDDDTEGADRAGDTAYRVATGVARVARAGAYVTGGALVAANGGGVPAQPGESRLDSWHTGWAHSTDPDPDQPSPVVTFPDPVVEPAPFSSHGSNSPVAHGNTAPGPVNPAPGFTLPGTGASPAGSLPSLGDYSGTDAGMPLPTLPGGESGAHGMQLPGHSGGGVPGLGGIPGTDGGSGSGSTIPGTEGNASHGFSLPGVRSEAANDVDAPGGHGFGLPGHGLGQAGHGFGLPGSNGFVAPGSTVFDLPGNSGVGAAPTADDPFDGVGAGSDLGAFVGTQWQVDFGLGPNGIYFTSEMKVDMAVGHVGDQLDEYTDWLADGIHVPDGIDHPVTESHGSGHPGLLGGLTSPGSSATQSSAASGVAQSSPAGTAQSSGVAQPLAASAPVAPAATVAPAASVAPAVAPAPAPAAIAAAPVVAATPLQTTIQPDVASTPIANVFAAPEGPSVLTAPAAAVPALFDAVRPTPAVKPAPVTDPHPSHSTHPTQPPASTVTLPTTIVQTTPTPSVPGDVTAPSAPKTPDVDVTKLPGATTAPHGGITTAPDGPTTKTPGATVTQTPAPHAPTTPDDDVTTPGGGTGRPGTGGTSHDTPPTNHLPTDDVPTVSRPAQPTYTSPDQPTYTAPDQPTYSAPAHAPTVEPYTPAPTFNAPAPTQAPIKPQVIDPKPHGISAPLMVDHSADSGFPVAEHTYDHSALTLASSGGLSSALLPESAMAETHHYASDVSDISLM